MMQWFWWVLIAFGVISIWVLLAMCQVASDADDRIEAGLLEDAAMADNSGRCVFCDKPAIVHSKILNGEPIDSVEFPTVEWRICGLHERMKNE